MTANPAVEVLVGFGRALRAEGMSVGTGDVLAYCAAVVGLDPTDLVDLYWAGHTTMVTRRDHIEVYDEVFARYFLGVPATGGEVAALKRTSAGTNVDATFVVPATEPGGTEAARVSLGLAASAVDVVRTKAFADCTDEELALLRRILSRLRHVPPRRRSRRTARARAGRVPDLRRTVRGTLRTHGDLVHLYWRERKLRPRPLVLVLDVSGSMADYSRALLQFAHTTRQAARKVEVFCFGTRLTRLTVPLRARRPDEALRRAARDVVDWEGGTRIGDSLDRFVRDWGRLARGAIVAICSDGLDRGDPETLAQAMARISLLCHRIVWLNPLGRGESLGMAAAGPYVDELVTGGDLASLERFAELLPTLS